MYSRFCPQVQQCWLCGYCRGKPHMVWAGGGINVGLSICMNVVLWTYDSSPEKAKLWWPPLAELTPWCLPFLMGISCVSVCFQLSLSISIPGMSSVLDVFFEKISVTHIFGAHCFQLASCAMLASQRTTCSTSRDSLLPSHSPASPLHYILNLCSETKN